MHMSCTSERLLVRIREAREGWPLLTVETKVNGNSKSTNKRGPFLVGSLGLLVQAIYSALAALVGPEQNIFFLTVHYFVRNLRIYF
jgi:hypothetical protein